MFMYAHDILDIANTCREILDVLHNLSTFYNGQ